MISSPCKNCEKRNYPKDSCLKECKLLQAIQDFQVSKEKGSSSPAIDYTEETRFKVLHPMTGTFLSY